MRECKAGVRGTGPAGSARGLDLRCLGLHGDPLRWALVATKHLWGRHALRAKPPASAETPGPSAGLWGSGGAEPGKQEGFVRPPPPVLSGDRPLNPRRRPDDLSGLLTGGLPSRDSFLFLEI